MTTTSRVPVEVETIDLLRVATAARRAADTAGEAALDTGASARELYARVQDSNGELRSRVHDLVAMRSRRELETLVAHVLFVTAGFAESLDPTTVTSVFDRLQKVAEAKPGWSL